MLLTLSVLFQGPVQNKTKIRQLITTSLRDVGWEIGYRAVWLLQRSAGVVVEVMIVSMMVSCLASSG